MNPTNSSDTGCSNSNLNWRFTAGVTTVNWDGATSSDWDTHSNWTEGIIPLTTDNVVIPSAGTDPIFDEAEQMNDLTIQVGGILDLVSFGLTVDGTFTNNGTLKLHGDQTVAAPTNASGSTVEYSDTTGTIPVITAWNYHHLTFDALGAT